MRGDRYYHDAVGKFWLDNTSKIIDGAGLVVLKIENLLAVLRPTSVTAAPVLMGGLRLVIAVNGNFFPESVMFLQDSHCRRAV
jgi:hypothetical protein